MNNLLIQYLVQHIHHGSVLSVMSMVFVTHQLHQAMQEVSHSSMEAQRGQNCQITCQNNGIHCQTTGIHGQSFHCQFSKSMLNSQSARPILKGMVNSQTSSVFLKVNYKFLKKVLCSYIIVNCTGGYHLYESTSYSIP